MKGLSKSRYTAFCQCPKNLWLKVFKPERVGDMLFVELKEKGNRQQLVGRIFVPEGENREVCGFDWNDEFVFIVADYYISRGYKGRHIENHEPQVLVGNEWVDHTKYREAIRRMDKRFLNGLITDEE